MTANKPFRFAVVTSHPLPYFAPLYADLTRDPEIEVTQPLYSAIRLQGQGE